MGRMSDETELYEQGLAALAAGAVRPEQPLGENVQRWGVAAVLRPEGSVLGRLEELSASVGHAAGEGHWVHHASALHFTLRSLEHFRATVPSDDPRCAGYADALDHAARGLAPARVELRGVCPHPGGVVAVGYPLDETMGELQSRFAAELRTRGLAGFESWVRDRWYVSLIHFVGRAAEVNTAAVAAWCEKHRQSALGTAELGAVEIIRSHQVDAGVRLETLHRTTLARTSVTTGPMTGR